MHEQMGYFSKEWKLQEIDELRPIKKEFLNIKQIG